MKPMTGEIGKLSLNGEQVGGFKYWTAIQNRNSLQTRVVASKFWLLKEIDTGELKADFYSHNPDGELRHIYSADITTTFPEYEVDKMMSKPISLELGTFNWVQGING